MLLHQVTGFGLALLSMVLFGLYMVPRKKSGAPQGAFTFWMGCGILAGTTALGLATGGFVPVSAAQYAMIFGSGVVWATGSDAYCRGVRLIGLSRSTPVKNISAALGMLLGVVVFREFAGRGAAPVVLVVLGSAAVVASANLLGRVEANGCESDARTDRRRLTAGVLCSLWAAIAYSVFTVPMKIVYAQGVSPSSFLVYMGQGCFAGMAALALVSPGRLGGKAVTRRDRRLAGLSGVMWAVGSLCANLAVKMVGVAVTWPLTKNSVAAVLFGVLVLREVNVARYRTDLRRGLVLSVVGVVLLALAVARG